MQSINHPGTIAFVGAKSAGHILPAVQLARNWYLSHNVLFFAGNSPLDKKIISQYTWIKQSIFFDLPVFSNKIAYIVSFIYFFFTSFVRSFYILRTFKAQKVISTGGSLSVPVSFAAWVQRIPVELYELNAIPGKATYWLSYIATKIYCCFQESQQLLGKKALVCKYPLQYTVDTNTSPAHIKKNLGIHPDKKIILILGGSQGSCILNEYMVAWCMENHQQLQHLCIMHQTGARDYQFVSDAYAKIGISAHLFDFQQRLESLYLIADLVVARAGAGTLFELEFFQKRSIIIPLETQSTDHQLYNAKAMANRNPALFTVIRQADIQRHPQLLFDQITFNHAAGQLSGFAPNPNV